MINFRTFTLTQLIALLNETGYESLEPEFAFARDNDCFKYIGCANGEARYLVGMEEEETEDLPAYYVAMVHVHIAHDRLQAEYSSVPVFHAAEVEEIQAYIEKRCN